MVGSQNSIRRANFNCISLINRQESAPKWSLIDLIRTEFSQVVISARKIAVWCARENSPWNLLVREERRDSDEVSRHLPNYYHPAPGATKCHEEDQVWREHHLNRDALEGLKKLSWKQQNPKMVSFSLWYPFSLCVLDWGGGGLLAGKRQGGKGCF